MPVAIVVRAIALGAIVLLLGMSFCLVQADHGVRGHLCGSVLAPMTGLLLAFLSGLVGRLIPALAGAYQLDSADLLPPPPKE